MKTIALYVGIGLLTLLTACSSSPPVLQPVGPAPQTKVNPAHDGYLVVYSAWSAFVNQDQCSHHSRYTIEPGDGSPSREVLNYADRFDPGPIRLPLPPGSYRVTTRAAHFGKVTVPVVIKERQTTYIYLDGSTHVEAPRTQGDVVKLPDGQVVGWSANATAAN